VNDSSTTLKPQKPNTSPANSTARTGLSRLENPLLENHFVSPQLLKKTKQKKPAKRRKKCHITYCGKPHLLSFFNEMVEAIAKARWPPCSPSLGRPTVNSADAMS